MHRENQTYKAIIVAFWYLAQIDQSWTIYHWGTTWWSNSV